MFDSLVEAQGSAGGNRSVVQQEVRSEAPLGPLRGQLGVVGRGEAPAQVLEDVKRQTAHQRDDGHLPQERYGGDEVNIYELVQEDK